MKAVGKYIVITEIKEQQSTKNGDLQMSLIYNLLLTMKGLCHTCFASNQTLTLDDDGLGLCSKCHEHKLSHKHQ